MDKLHKLSKFVLCVEFYRIHLLSHGGTEQFGHTFAHNHPIAVFVEDFLVRVYVIVYVSSAGECTVVLFALYSAAFVENHHIGPNLVDVGAVGKVNHIGGVTPCGTYIHLKCYEVANVANALVAFVEPEEFQVNKSAPYTECLHCALSEFA